ncbi:MAG: hypothetical protein MJA82_12445 [Clostridia bacterium]|nr:hypothetical protein [Clostridia bacterium]
MASFRGTMIYCTPIQAKKVDTYPVMNDSCIINRDDAKKLRDYYDAGESHVNNAIGLLTTIVSYPLGGFSVLFGTIAAFATSFATEVWEQRDTYFDELATNADGINEWKMDIKYKYRRKGSNDGAWVLESYVISPK